MPGAMSNHDQRHDTDLPPSGAEKQPADDNAATSNPESGDNARPREIGGRRGPEPTRYGDWEKKGRCIDF